jgi:O-antigen/teichoic acid export membrane protein
MSTKRHTLYNLGGAIAPVLMMLVTVPAYIHLVGEARYGVLSIVWVLTGYFSFFDFGLGRATAYAIARHKDSSDEMRARTFWTALIVNCGFGIVGGLILLLAAPLLFNHVFNLTPELRAELAPALPWLSLSIPLLTFEGVFTGALTGRERFLLLNVRTIIGTAITQFLPILFVWAISPSLAVALPATILARTISVAMLAAISFKAVPAGFKPMHGGREMMKELLGYGGWVGLSSFLNPLIVNLDRFLIASMLTPQSVAYYVVPYQLVTRASVFSSALSNALFPRLARLDKNEARELAWTGIRINATLMLIPCMVGILILQPFLAIWISPEFAVQSALIGQLIALSLWLNSMALIPFNLLQAQGRPKETTAILVLQVIPFIATAIPAVRVFGIVGAALARNVRSVADVTMLVQRAGLLGRTAKLAAPALLLLVATIVTARWLGPTSLAGAGVSLVLIAAAGFWAYLECPEVKNLTKLRSFRPADLAALVRR